MPTLANVGFQCCPNICQRQADVATTYICYQGWNDFQDIDSEAHSAHHIQFSKISDREPFYWGSCAGSFAINEKIKRKLKGPLLLLF